MKNERTTNERTTIIIDFSPIDGELSFFCPSLRSGSVVKFSSDLETLIKFPDDSLCWKEAWVGPDSPKTCTIPDGAENRTYQLTGTAAGGSSLNGQIEVADEGKEECGFHMYSKSDFRLNVPASSFANDQIPCRFLNVTARDVVVEARAPGMIPQAFVLEPNGHKDVDLKIGDSTKKVTLSVVKRDGESVGPLETGGTTQMDIVIPPN